MTICEPMTARVANVRVGVIPVETFSERKRTAGRLLHEAFEELFRVDGPAALARVTRRSKAWWSKLRSGKGGELPDWREIEQEVLPDDLPPGLRERLRERHREVWLLLHLPDFLSNPPDTPAPVFPNAQLAACREAARRLIEQCDFQTARNALKLLKTLLISQTVEKLPDEQRLILAQCLTDLATCEHEGGRYDVAVSMAQESLLILTDAPHEEQRALALHQLAASQYKAGAQADAVANATEAARLLNAFELNSRLFEARRKNAELLLALGRAEAAEDELLRLVVESEALAPGSRYPLFVSLVRVSLTREDAAKARYWFTRVAAFEKQHLLIEPGTERAPKRDDRVELERAVSRLEQAKAS